MKKKLKVTTMLIAFVLFTSNLFAQSEKEITPLAIGEEVPNFTFTKMVNYPAKEVELKDLKDKLVITDGWAIW